MPTKGKEVIVFDKDDLTELKQQIYGLYKMCEKLVQENIKLKGDKWLTIEEVAEYTGFSVDWVAKRQAEIGYFNQGGGRRFRKDKVDLFMQRHYIDYKPREVGKRKRTQILK